MGEREAGGPVVQAVLHVIRTGEDPDHPGQLLQVMPWPVYQTMTDDDLRAIYEYSRRFRRSTRTCAACQSE